jgi:hypothetical protein
MRQTTTGKEGKGCCPCAGCLLSPSRMESSPLIRTSGMRYFYCKASPGPLQPLELYFPPGLFAASHFCLRSVLGGPYCLIFEVFLLSVE